MIWQESCHHYSSVHTLYLRRVSSALIHSYLKKNTNSSLCVVSKWLFWWLNFSNTNNKWIKWNHRNVVYVRLGYCARQELKLQYEKLDLLLFINLGKKNIFLSCRKWKEQIVLRYTDTNTVTQSCPLVVISNVLPTKMWRMVVRLLHGKILLAVGSTRNRRTQKSLN